MQKNKKVKIQNEGDLCLCGTPMVKKIPNRKLKSNQKYYFEYYFLCPSCKYQYNPEEAKRIIDQN